MMKNMPGLAGRAMKKKAKKGKGKGGGRTTPKGGGAGRRQARQQPVQPPRPRQLSRPPGCSSGPRRPTHTGPLVSGPGRTRFRHRQTAERRTRGRQAPPHADGQEEAAHLPHRRRRRALAARRPVHRDHRHYDARREPSVIKVDNDRAVHWLQQRRPADRDRGQAAHDLRRHGRLQGREGPRGRRAVPEGSRGRRGRRPPEPAGAAS